MGQSHYHNVNLAQQDLVLLQLAQVSVASAQQVHMNSIEPYAIRAPKEPTQRRVQKTSLNVSLVQLVLMPILEAPKDARFAQQILMKSTEPHAIHALKELIPRKAQRASLNVPLVQLVLAPFLKVLENVRPVQQVLMK